MRDLLEAGPTAIFGFIGVCVVYIALHWLFGVIFFKR